MADKKICGNCASYYEVRPLMEQGSCFFDELDEYGCAPLHDGCEEACDSWEPKPITAEERCQQLEQLAREMYAAIAPMHVPCCEDTCLILADEGWPADACPQYFRQRLEELGVSLDDRQ